MAIEVVEGSGRAKLRSVLEALRVDPHSTIEFATVTAALPDIRIKVDNVAFELDESDLVICEHLTQHMRNASIGGGSVIEIVYEAVLGVNDRVIVTSTNGGQRYIVLDRIGTLGGV